MYISTDVVFDGKYIVPCILRKQLKFTMACQLFNKMVPGCGI